MWQVPFLAHPRFVVSMAALGATTLILGGAAYGCGDSNTVALTSDPDAAMIDGASPNSDTGADGATRDVGPVLDAASEASMSDAATADSALDGSASDATDDAHFMDATHDSGVDAQPMGPLATDYVDYEINHILVTGQSNAVASGARPSNTFSPGTTFTNTQPYANLMFDTGVMTSGPVPGAADGTNCNGSGCPTSAYVAPSSLVPLIENDSFFGGGDRVETASSSIANEISSLAISQFMFGSKLGYPTKHDVLVSLHGRSGNTYWCLRRGGCNYKPANELRAFDEAILQVQRGKTLATAAGKTYAVRAVATIHGESDHYGYQDGGNEFPLPGTNGVPNIIKDYSDGLIEWQADYESMIKGITGQAQSVPLLVAGLSGWTGARTSVLSPMQLSAHERAPGKVILVAPGYIFDPAIQSNGALECLHYSLRGQQHLGEYFAKAYAQMVFKGKPFEPVRPLLVQRVGSVITVKFLVPAPPLVIDTVRVNAVGISNYGFDFVDNGVIVAVASVVVSGQDTVTITLAAPPSAGAKRLRYALNQPIPGCIGPGVLTEGGARGNLRDSDPTPSLKGFSLFNWAVPFDVAVP